ncbi:MAG: peptidylprolyl isomerase [Tissierellia bacterium]|nr:peptidylprolyl isomerase [Tissierellia bacterium]
MEENKVLASVNGKDITEQDVYGFINQLPAQTATQFKTPEGMATIVKELVNQELMYLDAMEKGLNEEEDFINELEKVKASILKQYAIRKLLADVKVTEEEILEFYKNEKDNFIEPEKVRAKHILVETEEKAKEILEEIKNGLSFEEAAKKHSTCPSKTVGGDLGEFPRGKMVPEFEEAAFALEEGEISQPVKSQFGYHLIKLVSKKEASLIPYENLKDQIERHLLGLKQQEKYTKRIDSLKTKYEVNMYI